MKIFQRQYTCSFSNIDWGFRSSVDPAIGDDDFSCEGEGEGGAQQTGGCKEARKSTIVSEDSSSSDTTKKNHLRTAFDSFKFKGLFIKGIFAHHDEEVKDDDESLTDNPNATTGAGENKHQQQQPIQQNKSSSSSAAAPVQNPPSSQLDESDISVDDDGFLHWDRTKRTFTQYPENK